MSARSRGFTLLELLVAILFIAAIMFAIGYGTHQPGASTATRSLKDQQTQLLELQTAVRLLEQDFVQARPAPGAPGGRR